MYAQKSAEVYFLQIAIRRLKIAYAYVNAHFVHKQASNAELSSAESYFGSKLKLEGSGLHFTPLTHCT